MCSFYDPTPPTPTPPAAITPHSTTLPMFVEIEQREPIHETLIRFLALVVRLADELIDNTPRAILLLVAVWFMILAMKYSMDTCRVAPIATVSKKRD